MKRIYEPYICPRCGYSTEKRYNMKNHIECRKVCPVVLSDINLSQRKDDVLEKRFDTFGEGFQSSYVYLKFRIEASKKKILVLERNNEILSHRIDLLQQKSNAHQKEPKLQLNAFEESYIDCLTGLSAENLVASVVKTIELIHFHPDRPENHNVYISNLKGKFAHKYSDHKWTACERKELINELIRKVLKIFEDKGIPVKLNLEQRRTLRHNVTLTLYNNRKIVKATKKKTQ